MNQGKHLEVKILQFYLHIKAAKYITMKPEEKKKKNIFFYLNLSRNETVTVTERKAERHLQWQEMKQLLATIFFCASKTAFTQCKITKRKREKQTIISKISKDN